MNNHDAFVTYLGKVLTQCAGTHSQHLVNRTMMMNHISVSHDPGTGEPGYLIETADPNAPYFVAVSELGETFVYAAVCADAERLHATMQDEYDLLTGRGDVTDGGQGNEAEFEYASGEVPQSAPADLEGKAASVEDNQTDSPARQPAENSFSKLEQKLRNHREPTFEEVIAEIKLPESSTRSQRERNQSVRDASECEESVTRQPLGAYSAHPSGEATRGSGRRYRPELEHHDDMHQEPGSVSSPELD